jgi:NADH-quinone oxidoreductase subunit I
MFGTGLLQGLVVTARNLFRSYFDPEYLTTVQYPEERSPLPENSRSFPFLVFDNAPDNLRCVACKICEQECPPQCIYIEVERDAKTGRPIRKPRVFDIDYSVCMQCQICAEVCPFDAIKMDQVYELSSADRFGGMVTHKAALLKSNEYYHRLHPVEADEVDARLSQSKKKATPAGGKPVAAPIALQVAPLSRPAPPTRPVPPEPHV